MITGRMPTVPEYYMDFIDGNVDLIESPKQCCPFHQEKTPSFSYNIVTGRWSCFGQCHAHGDVIEMHRRKFHFTDKREAEKDLRIRYQVPEESIHEKFMKASATPMVSDEAIEDEATYIEALMLADCPERWLELDYAMSIQPYERMRIIELLNKWKGIKSVLE